jgi:hypothetical protein
MSYSNYDDHTRQTLERFYPGLSENLELMVDLSPVSAEEAVRYLLSLACEAQNARNISLGREYLAEIPRDWLVERIESCAEFLLTSRGEWEFRRLLEVYSVLDETLTRRLVERGQASSIDEIREAALEWADLRPAPLGGIAP